MGLNNWGRPLFTAVFAAELLAFRATAIGAELEVKPWPPAEPCIQCVAIQFGKLHMRLQHEDIGRIFVSGTDDGALHVFPKSDDAREGIVMQAVEQARYLEPYRAVELLDPTAVRSLTTFFDALGVDRTDNKAHSALREAEGIAAASHYIKHSKGAVSVFLIGPSAASEHWQKAYIVLDGDDVLYSASGNITPRLLEMFLSNLTIQPLP